MTRWADFDALSVGQSARSTLAIDAAMIEKTAALTGDDNPIHLDVEAANQFGQSRPTAHGVILLGAISRLIGTELPGPGSIWFKNDIEFLVPLFAGDRVEIAATVRQLSTASRVVVLDITATKSPDVVVATGRAHVKLPAPLITQKANTMSAESQVILVTGASGGIGKAIAEQLGLAGMTVVLGCHSRIDAARDSVKRIKDAGGAAFAVQADLAKAENASRLIDEAMAHVPRIDGIVHAATPRIAGKPFLETTTAAFREYHEAYVCVLAELVRLTAPAMKERKHGRIVTILSSYLAEVPPKFSAYVSAKHAALGLCRALAGELGPWNITINAVSPSIVVGQYTDELGAAAREILVRKTPLRRLAEPGDVAAMVQFLLGPNAGFVSGANLPVTGGILFP